MTRTSKILLSLTLCAGVSTPAMAAWDKLGSIAVRNGGDNEARAFDFGGAVERIQLRADGSDVRCRSVTATLQNGESREIFSGRLREGRTRDIDLPNNARNVTGLHLDCRAADRHGATIAILAEVGRYRADWMRGPNWHATWARVFNWGSTLINNWQYVGDVKFVGRHGSDTAWPGRRAPVGHAIALKPVDANARCSRVTARYANDKTARLAIQDEDYLSRGVLRSIDLPADRSDLTSISLRCRATDSRRVTIKVYSAK